VTERARVASLPDGTPVGDLPLTRVAISRLRVEGVLTLGDLRAMRDHDLLRLRAFGRGSLAAVRSLVPAPAAASSEVMIAGRRFTLGAVYEPAPHVRPYEPGRLLPLRLVGYDPTYPWPRGRVEAELVGVQGTRRRVRRLSGQAWVRWAGERVEEGEGR